MFSATSKCIIIQIRSGKFGVLFYTCLPDRIFYYYLFLKIILPFVYRGMRRLFVQA